MSQFGLPGTDQDHPEIQARSTSDQAATSVPGKFDRGLRRGTADTLVHAARTHLLHRSGPATVHPHAHLLHQSFELLEGRGVQVEACPSFVNADTRVVPQGSSRFHVGPPLTLCSASSSGASPGLLVLH